MINSPFIDIPDVLSINGDRLVVRKYFEEFGAKRKSKSLKQSTNEKNLRNNEATGLMNRKNRMKIKVLLYNWIEALKNSPKADNGFPLFQPTFVTLTLPTEQKHTDKELHQKALNQFTTQIGRSHKVKNYVWRAERQKNGNLHYHIIIDKYISHRLVRLYWNRIISHLGYIETYKNSQEEFHKEGFRVRNELLQKWPEEKQRKAYEEGLKTNWENPNSSDIHGLKNIQSVSDYVTKYMSKSDEMDKLQKLEKAAGQMSPEQFKKEKEIILQNLKSEKINARVWGCSEDLKNGHTKEGRQTGIKDPKIIVDYETSLFIEAVEKDETSRVITDENFKVIYCKNLALYLKHFKRISKEVADHHQGNFFFLYPEYKPKANIIITDFTAPINEELQAVFRKSRQTVLF
jgi:hypothetical protein